MEKWKQNLGSNATYSNLIAVFERAGYQEYAGAIKKLMLQSSADKTEKFTEKKVFPTMPECVPQPQLPQLPVFPQPEPILSSIALPSATAVLIEEEYQELHGQYLVQDTYTLIEIAYCVYI